MSLRSFVQRYYREHDLPQDLHLYANDGAHRARISREEGGLWGFAYEKLLQSQICEIAELMGGRVRVGGSVKYPDFIIEMPDGRRLAVEVKTSTGIDMSPEDGTPSDFNLRLGGYRQSSGEPFSKAGTHETYDSFDEQWVLAVVDTPHGHTLTCRPRWEIAHHRTEGGQVRSRPFESLDDLRTGRGPFRTPQEFDLYYRYKALLEDDSVPNSDIGHSTPSPTLGGFRAAQTKLWRKAEERGIDPARVFTKGRAAHRWQGRAAGRVNALPPIEANPQKYLYLPFRDLDDDEQRREAALEAAREAVEAFIEAVRSSSATTTLDADVRDAGEALEDALYMYGPEPFRYDRHETWEPLFDLIESGDVPTPSRTQREGADPHIPDRWVSRIFSRALDPEAVDTDDLVRLYPSVRNHPERVTTWLAVALKEPTSEAIATCIDDLPDDDVALRRVLALLGGEPEVMSKWWRTFSNQLPSSLPLDSEEAVRLRAASCPYLEGDRFQATFRDLVRDGPHATLRMLEEARPSMPAWDALQIEDLERLVQELILREPEVDPDDWLDRVKEAVGEHNHDLGRELGSHRAASQMAWFSASEDADLRLDVSEDDLSDDELDRLLMGLTCFRGEWVARIIRAATRPEGTVARSLAPTELALARRLGAREIETELIRWMWVHAEKKHREILRPALEEYAGISEAQRDLWEGQNRRRRQVVGQVVRIDQGLQAVPEIAPGAAPARGTLLNRCFRSPGPDSRRAFRQLSLYHPATAALLLVQDPERFQVLQGLTSEEIDPHLLQPHFAQMLASSPDCLDDLDHRAQQTVKKLMPYDGNFRSVRSDLTLSVKREQWSRVNQELSKLSRSPDDLRRALRHISQDITPEGLLQLSPVFVGQLLDEATTASSSSVHASFHLSLSPRAFGRHLMHVAARDEQRARRLLSVRVDTQDDLEAIHLRELAQQDFTGGRPRWPALRSDLVELFGREAMHGARDRAQAERTPMPDLANAEGPRPPEELLADCRRDDAEPARRAFYELAIFYPKLAIDVMAMSDDRYPGLNYLRAHEIPLDGFAHFGDIQVLAPNRVDGQPRSFRAVAREGFDERVGEQAASLLERHVPDADGQDRGESDPVTRDGAERSGGAGRGR